MLGRGSLLEAPITSTVYNICLQYEIYCGVTVAFLVRACPCAYHVLSPRVISVTGYGYQELERTVEG